MLLSEATAEQLEQRLAELREEREARHQRATWMAEAMANAAFDVVAAEPDDKKRRVRFAAATVVGGLGAVFGTPKEALIPLVMAVLAGERVPWAEAPETTAQNAEPTDE